MRAVVQRVSQASVEIQGQIVGSIGPGLLVLLGISQSDTETQAAVLADKITNLRIFPDADDKLNLALKDVNSQVLVVSQFTLWGDCAKGRRPSFERAASGEQAKPLYDYFIQRMRNQGLTVATGSFGAMMQVHLTNQGPVTLLLDTEKMF